jgi:hypothetical protein
MKKKEEKRQTRKRKKRDEKEIECRTLRAGKPCCGWLQLS